MLANYGYQDASGEFFITIDTDQCNGCRECESVCPAGVFSISQEDPYDPLREYPVAVVSDDKRKTLNDLCAPCKAQTTDLLPCIKACQPDAISHSW